MEVVDNWRLVSFRFRRCDVDVGGAICVFSRGVVKGVELASAVVFWALWRVPRGLLLSVVFFVVCWGILLSVAPRNCWLCEYAIVYAAVATNYQCAENFAPPTFLRGRKRVPY